MNMSDKERHERIAKMCREILDSERPLTSTHSNMDKRQAILTIDFLLRAVLGYSEGYCEEKTKDSLSYIEEKFFSAYNKLNPSQKVTRL